MATLASRRKKALWTILPMVGATATASGIPTPTLELPKQLAIGSSDIVLLARIYQVYFDQEATEQGIIQMLTEAGWLVASGAALAYGSVKMIEGCCAEALNFIPGIGWGISAAITGSVTLIVGAAWWWACDDAFCKSTTPVEAIKACFA